MEFTIPIYNVLLHILYCIPMFASILMYQNTKKMVYLYVNGMFLFYSIENIIVFMTEYSKEFSNFYNSIFITMPTIRTIIFTAVLLFMLLIVTSALDEKHNIPLLALLVIIVIFLLFVPIMKDGAFKSFIYYLPCQLYSFIVAEYGLYLLRNGKGHLSEITQKRFRSVLRCCALFSLLIILEDYIVIFHFDNYGFQTIDINNRSYTENIMTIWFSIIAIRIIVEDIIEKMNVATSVDVISSSVPTTAPTVAFDSTPVSEVNKQQNIPADSSHNFQISSESEPEKDSGYSKFYLFCREYQLTTREQDILRLLLEDKNNNEISEALYISVGTAKAHVHNVFAKVDVNRRKDLLKIYEEFEEVE